MIIHYYDVISLRGYRPQCNLIDLTMITQILVSASRDGKSILLRVNQSITIYYISQLRICKAEPANTQHG